MATQDGNPTTVDEAEAKKQADTDAQKEMDVMDVMMKQTQETSANRGACACCDSITRKINLAIEDGFYKLGLWIGKCPCIVLIITISILILCCIGLGNFEMEDDIENLWIPTDSPVWIEKQFIDKYWGNGGGGNILFVAESKTPNQDNGNILSTENLKEWYEFNIRLKTDLPNIDYTFTNEETNEEETLRFGLFYESFYPIIDLITLGEYGAVGKTVDNYVSKVIPFCRPAVFSPYPAQFQIPCLQYTLFDCFSEGGEFFPYDNYLAMTVFNNLAPANPYTYLRSSFEGMSMEELGDVIGLSCPNWYNGERQPFNYLYGGETRLDPSDEASRVTQIKTWRSFVGMDSIYGIAKKIKIGTRQCKYTVELTYDCPEITSRDLDEAKELYFDWLLLVIDWGLNEIQEWENDAHKNLKITMWNDRSVDDILADAIAADFVLIFISYFSMLIFAALTAFRPNNLFLSKSEASFFGVLLIILSVVATMGLTGSFVKVVPECINVIPFVAIGFGVDDMFVLIFAYKYRHNLSVPQMIAETIRIAGSSVALTSVANFLAFLISTQMVLPTVANFATFGTMIVLLNFLSVIFGFSAVLSLTSRRQKAGFRDWSFMCCFNDCTKYEPENNNNNQNALDTSSPTASNLDMLPTANNNNAENNNNSSSFDPFYNLLIKTPIRIFCLIICVILFIIGCAGINSIEVGLPIEKIVPQDSYAADFVAINFKYYTSQPFTLYTDGDGNNGEQKSIDWPNRFEDWLDTINKIHDVSPLVYDGMAVHGFWALGFQSYLQGIKQTTSLTDDGYALGEAFLLQEDIIYSSTLCEADRIKFCPSVGVEYIFPSPIFLCLYANQNYISNSCMDYLVTLLPDSFFEDYIWAKQLYITAFDGTNSTGLYVKSYSDETNVFYKYPCNNPQCDGYIFQAETIDDGCDIQIKNCPWFLLDSEFNLLYIGDTTPNEPNSLSIGGMTAPVGGMPSSNGWKDPITGRPAPITQHYMDFIVSAAGQTRQKTQFIYWDVPKITEFHYTGRTIWEYKLMKKLMSSSVTAYKSVSMGTFNSQIQCNAVLEATEICGAIRNNVSPGYINCGGIEQSAIDSNWYVGQCPNGYFSMTATALDSNNVNDITIDEACTCSDSSGSKTFNHLSSNVTATSDLDCFNPVETISLTCSQFTQCIDLSSCYEEFEEFTLSNDKPECNITDLQSFEQDFNNNPANVLTDASDYLAPCLFSYFSQLSDCCVESIQSVLLNVDDIVFSCNDINNYISNENYTEAKQQVCNSKDRCKYDDTSKVCANNCYNNVISDCSSLIYPAQSGRTFGPPMITDYTTLSVLADSESCCKDSLDLALTNGEQDCLIPKGGYWEYNMTTFSYDYSICDDVITALSPTCGTDYQNAYSLDPILSFTTLPNGNPMIIDHVIGGQLKCLYENINDIAFDNNKCCKNRIEQIVSDTRIMSRECEIDVNTFCQNCDYEPMIPCFPLTFAHGMYNQSAQCFATISTKAMQGALSPKCLLSFLYCQADNAWPITLGDQTANISCDIGYGGYQTRVCNASAGFADWETTIDSSHCKLLTCSGGIGPYDQWWPQTGVGSIATAQGGYNGAFDNHTQVNPILQEQSNNGKCTFPISTYYASRKCQQNPFPPYNAVWKDPIVTCRPAFAETWPEETKLSTTICDMLTSTMTKSDPSDMSIEGMIKGGNIIGVVPWDMIIPWPAEVLAIPEPQQSMVKDTIIIPYAQQYCESPALTNCVAFSYNSQTKFAFYFDYCGEIITREDLVNGSVPEYFPGYYDMAMYPMMAQAMQVPVSVVEGMIPVGYAPWSQIPDGNGGVLSEFADYMTTYIAPLSKAQFTAEYCSAMSGLDADISFIPATETWNNNGIPNPYCFNNFLWLYYTDPFGGVLSQSSIKFTVPYADLNISNTGIITTRNSFWIKNMDSDQDGVDTILSVRSKLKEWQNDEFYVIPAGFVISFWSRYIGVEDYMLTNLIMVTFAVIGVGFVFLLNPIAVCVCVVCNIMMVIEVYGFSHYVGLGVDGVLVLNIVVAIGLTMEFTAHIGRAFVLTSHSGTISLSEGQDRMKQTLKEMFVPVTLGAVTTIIGIAPISAAKLPYFKLYYFNLYVLIVVFGWLNGVIFQPIILSLWPPKSFELPDNSKVGDSSSVAGNNNHNTQTSANVELGTL